MVVSSTITEKVVESSTYVKSSTVTEKTVVFSTVEVSFGHKPPKGSTITLPPPNLTTKTLSRGTPETPYSTITTTEPLPMTTETLSRGTPETPYSTVTIPATPPPSTSTLWPQIATIPADLLPGTTYLPITFSSGPTSSEVSVLPGTTLVVDPPESATIVTEPLEPLDPTDHPSPPDPAETPDAPEAPEAPENAAGHVTAYAGVIGFGVLLAAFL